MYIECHGGECCGIVHLIGFGNVSQDETCFHGLVDGFVAEQYDHAFEYQDREEWENYGGDEESWAAYKRKQETFNALLEATLTDNQMRSWAPILKKKGFRLVSRFLNSNSGNWVNVLHFQPHARRGRNAVKRPFKY